MDERERAAEWLDPVALDRVDPPAWPLDVLPPWLVAVVVAIAAACRVTTDLVASFVVGALSAASSGRLTVAVSPSFSTPALVWVFLMSDSGTGKSRVVETLGAPLSDLDACLAREWEDRTARQRAEAHDAEQTHRRLSKARDTQRADKRPTLNEVLDAERVARELRDAVPSCPRLLVEDITPESLVVNLAEHGGHLAVLTDEAAPLARLTGVTTSRSGVSLDATLKGWDGGTIRSDRKGATKQDRETLIVPRAHLALCVAAQRTVLAALMGDDELAGRGWSARLMIEVCGDLAGSRDFSVAAAMPDMTRWSALGSSTARRLIESPATVAMSPAASARFLAWQNDGKTRLRPACGPMAT